MAVDVDLEAVDLEVEDLAAVDLAAVDLVEAVDLASMDRAAVDLEVAVLDPVDLPGAAFGSTILAADVALDFEEDLEAVDRSVAGRAEVDLE